MHWVKFKDPVCYLCLVRCVVTCCSLGARARGQLTVSKRGSESEYFLWCLSFMLWSFSLSLGANRPLDFRLYVQKIFFYKILITEFNEFILRKLEWPFRSYNRYESMRYKDLSKVIHTMDLQMQLKRFHKSPSRVVRLAISPQVFGATNSIQGLGTKYNFAKLSKNSIKLRNVRSVAGS